jgi:hypothetical protein
MVVSGQVSTIPDQNFIELGRTSTTERLPIPVSGAYIELVEVGGEVYYYQEDPFKPGIYVLNDFSGIPGAAYFVRVVTQEGETFESEPERMPESAGSLTTTYDFQEEEVIDLGGVVTEQTFMKWYVDATLPESKPVFVKWQVDETFLLSPTDFPDPFGSVPPPCFVSQNADPQTVTLFNGRDIQATSVEKMLVGSRIIDWSFLEKHWFTIYQSSLTEEAYEYWRKVNILANQVGSIFDTPPADISGNVKNLTRPTAKVLGYVQACNQAFDRRPFFPSELPFRLTITDCTYDGRDYLNYPSRCLDCLSIRNSSFRRPIWF